MNKLTPEQKQSIKEIIDKIIESDKSAFFFLGSTGTDEEYHIKNALALTVGHPDVFINSLLNQASKDPSYIDGFIRVLKKHLSVSTVALIELELMLNDKSKNQ